METPILDPWVPPSLRKAAPRPPAEGVELKAQVERKLRASFDAADVAGAGSLTREQAGAAGLGFVVKNFDRIDAAGTGRVTFDELTRHLRAQGADPRKVEAGEAGRRPRDDGTIGGVSAACQASSPGRAWRNLPSRAASSRTRNRRTRPRPASR